MNDSQNFIGLEVIGGKLLLLITLIALLVANSPWHVFYENFFHQAFYLSFNYFKLKIDSTFLINDGLMTIFFLVVGLQIKYEILQGELNSLNKVLLPGIAALGGMII